MNKAQKNRTKRTRAVRPNHEALTVRKESVPERQRAGTCRADGADWHAELFRLLADPNRLRIIYRLLDGPLNVGEISAAVGLEQSLVSHHLATLRKSNLVVATRAGRIVRYELPKEIAVALDGKTLDLGCCIVTFRRSTTDDRPTRRSVGPSPLSLTARRTREAS